MPTKNKALFDKIIMLALIVNAVAEFLIIQYFNICEANIHIGIDASWEYLKLAIISEIGGFFPTDVLTATTVPGTAKIFLLIAPINRIIHNIWVSFGIGVGIITIICVYLLWKIATRLNMSNMAKLVIVNLFLCPYLANGFDRLNDLGYFSCVNGIPAYQDTIVLMFFLTILVMSYDEIKLKEKIIIGGTLGLYVFNAVSSGISLILFCGTPTVIYVLVKVFTKNDYKELIHWKALFLYGVNIAIVLGRAIGGMLGYTYGESVIYWVTAPEFFENLQSEFLGYMMLVGAVPGTGALRTPGSLMGISYAAGLIIFVVILVAIIVSAVFYFKEEKENAVSDVKLFGFSTIVIITVAFAFLNTHAGQDIFETRYLINSLLMGFIFVGFFIDDLEDSLVFKKFGIVVLTISIIGMNLFSDYILAITDNKEFKVDEFEACIDQTDAGLVYFWDSGIDLIPSYTIIRVQDLDRIYKCVSKDRFITYGAYKTYDDSTEYKGPTVLIINDDSSFFPKEIIEKYTKIDSVDNYDVYYCESNPIDLQKMVNNQ